MYEQVGKMVGSISLICLIEPTTIILVPEHVVNTTLDGCLRTLRTSHIITRESNHTNPTNRLKHDQAQRCLDNITRRMRLNHVIDNIISHDNQDNHDNQRRHK